MLDTPEIRPALPTDAPRIVDFQLAMALETEHLELHRPTVEAGVAAVFEDPAKGCYWVAVAEEGSGEGEGEVVASLLITPEWSDWRNGTVWWIQSVYVVPAARRQGVYRRMYARLRERVAGDPDVAGLRLYVDRRNTAAQEVYTALGMDGEHYRVFEWMDT